MADEKAVWDLSDILEGKTTEQIETELREKVETFKKVRNELSNISIQRFKEVILLKEDISTYFSKIKAYLEMKFFENTADSKTLGEMTKLEQTLTELSNELMFFSLWFIDLDDEKASRFIDAAELSNYKYYLKELRKSKPYTKSEEVEKIINIKSSTGGDATAGLFEIFTAEFKYDFEGEKNVPVEKITSNYASADPRLRKASYQTVLKRYKENKTVLSEIYKNIVLDWRNEAMTIRGYTSPISVRNLSNDVTDKSVKTMLDVVRANNKLFREYFKVKYEINKKNGDEYEFSRYHIYAPFKTELKGKYSYAKSKEIVLEAYKEFHPKFYEKAKEIFDANHVHSHPQLNKRSGAFCYGISPKDTAYILLNHSDTLMDVFTMIHEFGHGIHDELSRKQTSFNFHPPLVTAETASIFSEMMLSEKMLNASKSDKEKIYLLIRSIDHEWASIIRQAYFLYFEEFAHDNIHKGITKEELDEKYYELLKEQFGDMEIPEEFKEEWNYIPHIHASPFYVYAYAWGNLFVLALFDMYKKEGEPFKEKYIKFLEAGGSKSPADLMKELGVDPEDKEFWQRGFNIISEQIEQLKDLNNKL